MRERVRAIIRFRRLGIPAAAADDLEQEIVTQIWQAVNGPSFDPTAGLWGFVELVAARRCIDWRRLQKDRVPLIESLRDERSGPLEHALSKERDRLVGSALESLDPGCRELVSLRLEEDLSYREIGERLGKSEGALRVQMSRCVERARSLLEERPDKDVQP